MAAIITFAQRKGGAGKTTLAAHLAAGWAAAGRRVALLDVDPQRSLTQWVELRRKRLGSETPGFVAATVAGGSSGSSSSGCDASMT